MQQFEVEDASSIAEESVSRAAQLAPTNPDVPYLSALIAFIAGDRSRSEAKAHEALILKSDYAPAKELLLRLASGT